MTNLSDTHSNVLHVLELACGGILPAGARGTLYASIDHLWDNNSPEGRRRIAERAAVALVQMEWAVRKRDDAAISQLQNSFRELHDAWQSDPDLVSA